MYQHGRLQEVFDASQAGLVNLHFYINKSGVISDVSREYGGPWDSDSDLIAFDELSKRGWELVTSYSFYTNDWDGSIYLHILRRDVP
jgi:hypothetical protein